MNFSRPIPKFVLPAILLGFVSTGAYATDSSWLGTTSTDYNDPTNWSGSLVPAPNGNATFNGLGNGNTTLTDTTTLINILTFATGAAAYTLGATPHAGTISLSNTSGGTITLTAGLTTNQLINSDILLSSNTPATNGAALGNYSLANATANTLTVAGNISGDVGGTAGVKTLTLSGTGNGTISGNITPGGASGMGLIDAGTGTWTLSGNNVLSGGPAGVVDGVSYTQSAQITAAGGTLVLATDTALNGTGMTFTTTTNILRVIGINSTIQAAGGTRTIANTFMPASNAVTNITGSNVVFTGSTIGNQGGISLNINNAATSFVNIDARDGSTSSGTARVIGFTGSSNITVNGVISGGSAPGAHVDSLSYQGNGSLTLTKTNTYIGTTTLAGGGKATLDFSVNNPATILPNTGLILGGAGSTTNGIIASVIGGNLILKGNSGTSTTQTVTSLALANFTGDSIRFNQNGSTGLNLSVGAITRNAGSTLDLTLPTTGALTTTTTSKIGTNGLLSNGVANAPAYATVDGTTWATNTAGTIGALASGSYQANVFTDPAGDTDVTTSFATGGASTANTLRFNAAGNTLTLGGLTTLGAGAILNTAAGVGSVITGSSLQAGTNGSILIHDYGTLTVASALVGNGGVGSLTKTGPGTTTLSGANTYTGTTVINGGTLQFAKEVSLYNNTTASWTAGNILVTAGGTAAFNVGGTGEFTSADIDTIKAVSTGIANGFMNGSTLGLDTTNAAGGTFTYATAIANTFAGANAVGVAKLGANTLVLTGSNTFTGPTTVKGGTLTLNAATGGALATSSAVTINSGATLLLGTANQIKDTAPMSLAGGTFNTGGLNETLGTLSMTASSVLDLASGASIIHFADSSALTWTGTLSIWNWSGNMNIGGGTDQIYIGTTATSLSFGQVSQVQFYSGSGTGLIGGGMLLANGELVAVPEPSQYALGIMALLGAVIYLRRRRSSYAA